MYFPRTSYPWWSGSFQLYNWFSKNPNKLSHAPISHPINALLHKVELRWNNFFSSLVPQLEKNDIWFLNKSSVEIWRSQQGWDSRQVGFLNKESKKNKEKKSSSNPKSRMGWSPMLRSQKVHMRKKMRGR